MLLPDNIHPKNSIYYNGAFVLLELRKQRKQELMELYQNVIKNCRMSFPVFVLSLDWLYILNAAKIDSTGTVNLCS